MRHNPEQHEILGAFNDILAGPTGDGGNKRAAGTKPLWKVDTSHAGAAWRHYNRWIEGERVDAESGCHPLAHAAWRLLAIAYQEMRQDGLIPNDPEHITVGPHHPDWEWPETQPITDGEWV